MPRRTASPWEGIVARGLPERLDVASGVRVLHATSVGGHPVAPVIDSLAGMGSWVRGAEVSFLLCDGLLPACEACELTRFPRPQAFVKKGPQGRLCRQCLRAGTDYLAPLPVPTRRYSELVSQEEARAAVDRAALMDVSECFSFARDGLRLGEHARASVIRFFGKTDLSTEPEELVLGAARRYLAGADVAARVAEKFLETMRPDVVVSHHGIYVPQGVLGEVCRRDGVRVVNWGPSYRNTTAIFSHGDTYHHTLIDEPTSLWDGDELTPGESDELVRYLAERRIGKGDWTWMTPEAALRPDVQQREDLLQSLQLDPEIPTYGLLTNVSWDAALIYEGNTFPNMLSWIDATVEHFKRSGRQLIIRCHPHEVKANNREPVAPILRQRHPDLPETIKVVEAESELNTYALMDLCRAVLIYGTKTGVELTPLGKPVVVAGEAWIRDKGLTIDVTDREHYGEILDGLDAIQPLDEATVTRARRYAHHFFFRRMIPLSSLDPAGGVPPALAISSLADLMPGNDPGLDVICDGVLTGSPFVQRRA